MPGGEMTSGEFYVRVRGAWDSSPSIYIGPFESRDTAQAAVNKSGVGLDPAAPDPKRDVVVSVLSDVEARETGRRDRHTLPPRGTRAADAGFEVPADLAEFNMIFYRLFGYH
jgi:hypothetical protein